jgi:hypothetical protein
MTNHRIENLMTRAPLLVDELRDRICPVDESQCQDLMEGAVDLIDYLLKWREQAIETYSALEDMRVSGVE